MDKNLHNIFGSTDCLPDEVLTKYVNDELSENERHRVERHTLDCNACSDTVEGLLLLKEQGHDIAGVLGGLTTQVDAKTSVTKTSAPRIRYAAVIILLLGLGGYLMIILFPSQEPKIAEQVHKEETHTEEPAGEIEELEESDVSDDREELVFNGNKNLELEPDAELAEAKKPAVEFEKLEVESKEESQGLADAKLKNTETINEWSSTGGATTATSVIAADSIVLADNENTTRSEGEIALNADLRAKSDLADDGYELATVDSMDEEEVTEKEEELAQTQELNKERITKVEPKNTQAVPAATTSDNELLYSSEASRKKSKRPSRASRPIDEKRKAEEKVQAEQNAGEYLEKDKKIVAEEYPNTPAGKAHQLYDQRRYEESYNAFKDIYTSDSTNLQAAYYSGSSLYQLKRFEEAIPYFRASTAKRRTSFYESGLYYQGLCLIEIGKNTEAKVVLQKVVDFDGGLKKEAQKQLKKL